MKKILYKNFTTQSHYPHLLIFGAVHGNEKCGTNAINELIKNLTEKKIQLKTGKLTCVPICNPEAYKQNKRFITNDLNRNFLSTNITEYEGKIREQLKPLIQSADILLDIHSYSSFGREFCFLGLTNQDEIDFCLNLGVDNFIYGWSEAFKSNSASIGTVEFARLNGAIATTLECGHHDNPQNNQIAYNSILNALSYFNMIEKTPLKKSKNQNFFKMQKVFYKEKPGEFIKKWHNLDYIAKNEIIARFNSTENIKATNDGHIILPKQHAQINKEWFYFATKELLNNICKTNKK